MFMDGNLPFVWCVDECSHKCCSPYADDRLCLQTINQYRTVPMHTKHTKSQIHNLLGEKNPASFASFRLKIIFIITRMLMITALFFF